jgi:hypothetical protein
VVGISRKKDRARANADKIRFTFAKNCAMLSACSLYVLAKYMEISNLKISTGRWTGGYNTIEGRKNVKKRGQQPFDRPFELGFGFWNQQIVYGGVGSG